MRARARHRFYYGFSFFNSKRSGILRDRRACRGSESPLFEWKLRQRSHRGRSFSFFLLHLNGKIISSPNLSYFIAVVRFRFIFFSCFFHLIRVRARFRRWRRWRQQRPRRPRWWSWCLVMARFYGIAASTTWSYSGVTVLTISSETYKNRTEETRGDTWEEKKYTHTHIENETRTINVYV